jgi:hypothetical protein
MSSSTNPSQISVPDLSNLASAPEVRARWGHGARRASSSASSDCRTQNALPTGGAQHPEVVATLSLGIPNEWRRAPPGVGPRPRHRRFDRPASSAGADRGLVVSPGSVAGVGRRSRRGARLGRVPWRRRALQLDPRPTPGVQLCLIGIVGDVGGVTDPALRFSSWTACRCGADLLRVPCRAARSAFRGAGLLWRLRS